MFSLGISSTFTFGLSALARSQEQTASSLEKLSTGKRINRAADDPAGMIAAENHNSEIYALNKQLDIFGQKEGFLGAKEGGLSVLSDTMAELQSLVVRAANEAGTTEHEQAGITLEIDSIIEGIDRIATNTTFKGTSVLQEYRSQNLHADLKGLASILVKEPQRAQEIVEETADRISTTRAAIGNSLREIDKERAVIGEQLINLNASLSTIEDTDFAAEAAKLVRSQIMEQAATMAININRQNARSVLDLLRGAGQPNALG